MYKVGIIGFGKMGKIRAREIEASKRGQIVKVYDSNKETDFYNYPVATSPEEIIKDNLIDIIFIATPNYLNQPLTIAALSNGKHVFCEKPPAFTSSEVSEVQEVEKKAKRALMYGFNHRHHCSVRNIKKLVDSGVYGDILWMRGRYGKSVDDSFSQSWRSKKKLAGGGILMDQGIHMVDLFLFLAGDFDKALASVQNCYWKGDVEDNVFAILKNTKSNFAASLHSTMTQWRHLFSLEVFLSKGYMVLNGLQTSSKTYGDEVLSIAKNRTSAPRATWEDEEETIYRTDKSWAREIKHFFDAIDFKKKVQIGNSDDALKVMKTIEAIYKSDPSYER